MPGDTPRTAFTAKGYGTRPEQPSARGAKEKPEPSASAGAGDARSPAPSGGAGEARGAANLEEEVRESARAHSY